MVDIHTHVYLQRYIDILSLRKELPYIRTDSNGALRIVILPGEDADTSTEKGRLIEEDYWKIESKLEFMDRHGIQISVISLANPWLSFLNETEQVSLAPLLNDDLEVLCKTVEGRLYGFGVLPLQNVEASVKELHRISKFPHIKGIILDASGRGNGLDDPQLLPLFAAAEELGLTLFVHPHSGVANDQLKGYGHSLYLALGFPFQTTTSIARLILSGVLEKHPSLKLLLAHSGGVLPYLAGRLDKCVSSDESFDKSILKKSPSQYLKMLYYDAITYHSPALNCAIEFVGIDRLLFGTDHPFSISDPQLLYQSMKHLPIDQQEAIKKNNAFSLLNIPPFPS